MERMGLKLCETITRSRTGVIANGQGMVSSTRGGEEKKRKRSCKKADQTLETKTMWGETRKRAKRGLVLL